MEYSIKPKRFGRKENNPLPSKEDNWIIRVHMTIDTNTMVSITEANQNFSKVARLVDEKGSAVILKNNVPRYLVIDFSKADDNAIASDEDVLSISKRLIEQNREAYEVLAK